MRASEEFPWCTRQCAACGAWYCADTVLGPGLVNVQAALARTCELLEVRLRATRGDLDAARHERQWLRDEVRARDGQLCAFQQEQRRLQGVVEALGVELRAAREQQSDLQQKLVEARSEVERVRDTRERQRSKEEILLWQLGAARAEAQELREEVARLEAEAAGFGGLRGGRHSAPSAGG